ncbi:MAG: endonuclease/exonuclease/phosphatase family protein, partial [Muribaculaceae bacterium]|nr:endonuclease/exonuclease/phosphatase family protein [Muribaculaceae bacterium]
VRMIASIVSIIVYLITAFCCFGGAISPTFFPLGSVAVIGMPVMLTISAIITIAWFCCGHWIIGSAGVLMFIACASPIKMWFPMNSSSDPDPEAPTLKILTWNIQHGTDYEHPDSHQARTLSSILSIDADVVCLQEIYGFRKDLLKHYSQPAVDSLFSKYPYRLGNGKHDLQVLSKYPLRHIYFGTVNHYTLSECFVVKTPAREIAMANVHLPSFLLDADERTLLNVKGTNKKDKERLGLSVVRKMERVFPGRAEAAEKVINGFDGLSMPTIVVGDFNDVPASWTYRLFLKDGFQDAYVATNFFPTYTYYLNHMYFHLDQIFYRGGVRPLSVEKLNIPTSDHLPLVATFQILEGY